MRHKCLKFCPLFHTAVLLFARFKVTDELQRLDFTNNKNWYKHKLIANVNCCKDFKYIKDRMGGRFYEDKIKQLQTALNMELPGVLHVGRKIAVCIMEILQIPLEWIKELGMWNLDVCTEHYSTKLAIRALKAYSGYKKGPKAYFLIRNELGTSEVFCLLWPELDDLRKRAIEVKKRLQHIF